MNIRGEVHAYLAAGDYRRLRLEALARGVSLSRCAADCLAEYFALRQEMATAFETPDQAGAAAPSRVIHVLLAQTEQRLVATLERYGEDLTAARAELPAVLAMLEDLHWIDGETQAVLESLVKSLPAARLCLLVRRPQAGVAADSRGGGGA